MLANSSSSQRAPEAGVDHDTGSSGSHGQGLLGGRPGKRRLQEQTTTYARSFNLIPGDRSRASVSSRARLTSKSRGQILGRGRARSAPLLAEPTNNEPRKSPPFMRPSTGSHLSQVAGTLYAPAACKLHASNLHRVGLLRHRPTWLAGRQNKRSIIR